MRLDERQQAFYNYLKLWERERDELNRTCGNGLLQRQPEYKDFNAGIDIGFKYAQAEINQLKVKLVTLQYSQPNQVLLDKIAKLEELNATLVQALSLQSEINERN